MNARKIRTVIVDDENRIRRGIEKLVLSCGKEWNVIATFGDGQELIDMYHEEPFEFDVLITDVRMPVVDGLTLIKEMKKLTSFSPMVISGFDDFAYLQIALREGALDYLIKPIDREEFRQQLVMIKEKIKSKWNDEEERDKMKKQASQLTYTKQVEKLTEVTNGFDMDVSVLDFTKDFPKGKYALMYITIDQALSHSRTMDKDEWRTWVLAHENILNEMLSESIHDCWKWRGEGATFWLLLNCCCAETSETSFKQDVYNFACLLRENVKVYTPFFNSIAISQVFTDLSLLQTVTKDVLALMRYRLIFGNNQILQQDMEEQLVHEYSEVENSSELQRSIQRIIQAIEHMNEDELKQQIATFTTQLQSLRLPNEIELFVQSFSIQLVNYLIKNTPRLSSDLLDIQDTVSLLKGTGDFSEFQGEMERWILEVFKKLEQANKEKVLDQVKVAKEWIKENIKENITIEKISRQVFMNPTYFSEYFKNQTGETVLDFVTSTRINKARELLLTTNLKVYEISEQVGYADTKYFSKLFKKYYGELPSRYKEKITEN